MEKKIENLRLFFENQQLTWCADRPNNYKEDFDYILNQQLTIGVLTFLATKTADFCADLLSY